MRDLSGKLALVTGGTRGIGRAIACELARRGADVVVNFRRDERAAQDTLLAIANLGTQGEAIAADLGEPAQVEQMFGTLDRGHTSLDILVNCAGITRDELLMMMRPGSWRDVLGTNLAGVFGCTRLALERMPRAMGGVVVNIGSGACFGARPGQTNYATAKSALAVFSRALATQVAPRGVRVVLVAPGFTNTDMSALVHDEVQRASLGMIPMGRWGEPEEIASVVGFAASARSRYVTGATFAVDGGRNIVEQEYGF